MAPHWHPSPRLIFTPGRTAGRSPLRTDGQLRKEGRQNVRVVMNVNIIVRTRRRAGKLLFARLENRSLDLNVRICPHSPSYICWNGLGAKNIRLNYEEIDWRTEREMEAKMR